MKGRIQDFYVKATNLSAGLVMNPPMRYDIEMRVILNTTMSFEELQKLCGKEIEIVTLSGE